MSSFVDELIDRGYTIDEQLRAYKDRYIAIFAGIKVYVKPTDDSEVIALMELKGTTGVPRLVDSFVSPTVGPVVAVQYVPSGKGIGDVIDEGHLSFSEKVDIANQLLDIVLRIHKRGWVHGDINFDNVLLDTRLNVFLIDYEASFKPAEGLPDNGVLYPPPESLVVRRGGYISQSPTYRPDIKYDYWTLGLILFMLFRSNQIPLPGASTFMLDDQEQFDVEKIYEPYHYHNDLPPTVNELLSNLLSHDRASRILSPKILPHY